MTRNLEFGIANENLVSSLELERRFQILLILFFAILFLDLAPQNLTPSQITWLGLFSGMHAIITHDRGEVCVSREERKVRWRMTWLLLSPPKQTELFISGHQTKLVHVIVTQLSQEGKCA